MTSSRARFQHYRDEHWPAIRAVIDRAVVDGGLKNSSLAQMLDYQMGTGGKRLRAVLPLMVADVLGKDIAPMIPFGAACELIHNATLVHDDLQDGDRVRRGQPAVWTHFGSAQAINLGDALLYLAPRCLNYIEVDPGRRWEVASRLFGDVLGVIDGQEREFALEFCSSTRGDYERMVVGKTSGLFSLPMVGAAMLCGAGEDLIGALDGASKEMGVIFQLQDDIVDLYGEKGRSLRGGDLREGKISALVVAFRDLAPDQDVERLRQILEADREATDKAEVDWAATRFRQSGALSVVAEAIEERRQRALSADLLGDHQNLQGLIDGLIDVFLEPIQDVFES